MLGHNKDKQFVTVLEMTAEQRLCLKRKVEGMGGLLTRMCSWHDGLQSTVTLTRAMTTLSQLYSRDRDSHSPLCWED